MSMRGNNIATGPPSYGGTKSRLSPGQQNSSDIYEIYWLGRDGQPEDLTGAAITAMITDGEETGPLTGSITVWSDQQNYTGLFIFEPSTEDMSRNGSFFIQFKRAQNGQNYESELVSWIIGESLTGSFVPVGDLVGVTPDQAAWLAQASLFVPDPYDFVEVSTHIPQTTNVHGIPDTSVLATQTEVADGDSTVQGNLDAHVASSALVHGITDTSLIVYDADLAAHSALDTDVHGVTNPDTIESVAGAQSKADTAEANANAYTDTHEARQDNPHVVAHSQLADKGTNTHAAIDAHIAAANPHSDSASSTDLTNHKAGVSGEHPLFSGSGSPGFVPDPVTGYTGSRFLREDGSFAVAGTVDDVTDLTTTTGNPDEMLRVATGGGLEYRTPVQVVADIGALAPADIGVTVQAHSDGLDDIAQISPGTGDLLGGNGIWQTVTPSDNPGAISDVVLKTGANGILQLSQLGVGIAPGSIALNIHGNNGELRVQNTLLDDSNKVGRVTVPNYTSAELPHAIFGATSIQTSTWVDYGGGSSIFKPVTSHRFYAATNAELHTGTRMMEIAIAGVGIGENVSPTDGQLYIEASTTGKDSMKIRGIAGQTSAAIRVADDTNTDVFILNTNGRLRVIGAFEHQGTTLGFYNSAPQVKLTVSGSRGGNLALESLLSRLDTLGLITDSTSA